ncbi:MAG: hypothetical protein ACLFU2_05845 [Opitutales bacterium]
MLLLVQGAALGATEMAAWSAWRQAVPASALPALRTELERVYLPGQALERWFRFTPEAVWVRVGEEEQGLWLELPVEEDATLAPRLPAPGPGDAPLLEGWRIAIDPGHLGGEWGEMERRAFRLGEGPVVREGDLVLAAAKRMAAALRERGAEVRLLREGSTPATDQRPADFFEEAFRDLLRERGELPTREEVQRLAELRFYRLAEIRARAELVAQWRPHVVLALHLNAEAWPDPEAPSAVPGNHGHLLVNGAYLPGEVAVPGQRRELLARWLARYSEVEVPLARALAKAMEEATGLSPFRYRGPNAAAVGGSDYVWARNLLANRIYPAPVVYLEPWV